jgi:hypothetical protein
MRRHLTYANVVATLALVFAMTGGAIAAKHYLINSTKQIKPSVLKQLKKPGRTGATGAQGKQGLPGVPGAAGTTGPIGPSNLYSTASEPFVNLQFGENPTLASVAVPAGSYFVIAAMQANNATINERVNVGCELVNDVNGDHGEAEVTLEPLEGKKYNGRAQLTVQASSTLASAGHWLLKCNSSAAKGEVLRGEKVQLNAIQVGSLSRS